MASAAKTAPAGGHRPDHLVPCPDCDGNGEFLEPHPTFDLRQEQWYPNDTVVPCARCEGLGFLDLDDPRRFDAPRDATSTTSTHCATAILHTVRSSAPVPATLPEDTMTDFQIRKATKSEAKLRMAVFGPSGSGKTMSALRLAHGLGGKVGLIDTERGSASKYSDRWPFDVIELDEATIENYTRAMGVFADAGYDVLIVDSISHAWEWLLDHVEKLGRTKYHGNKWSAWSEATPMQQKLVDAILAYPGHVIATMRSKTEWVTEQNERGKSQPRRIGIAPRQRDGVEYEFDVLLEMDAEANTGRIIKDRTGRFQDRIVEKPDEALGRELAAWLADGEAPARPAGASAADEPRTDESRTGETGAPVPAPAQRKSLTDDQAARLAKALESLGVGPEEQLEFAAVAARRPLASLSELSVAESKRVHAQAKDQRQAAA